MEVNLVQGTPEWLEARRNYIGASDVACILGVSPWKSAIGLWEEKLGIAPKTDEKKEWLFQIGHQKEEEARMLFESKFKILIPPAVVRKEDLAWMQASLDGYNPDEDTLVEIKYLGRDKFHALKTSGDVPVHYYPQLQYQMICTGIREIYFVGITQNKLKREDKVNSFFDGIAFTKVSLDLPFCIDMVARCEVFWQQVQNKIRPGKGLMDYEVSKNPLTNALIEQCYFLQSKLEASRNDLMKYLPEGRVRFGNLCTEVIDGLVTIEVIK